MILKSGYLALFPCMASDTMVFASDLELPGFPTRKRGILSSMQTTIMNTFSFKAVFLAMFFSKLTLSKTTSWHLKQDYHKSCNLIHIYIFNWTFNLKSLTLHNKFKSLNDLHLKATIQVT